MMRTAEELRAKKAILFLLILISGLAFFSVLLYPRKANSGPYLNSTHGNSGYGVNRSSIAAFGYPRGHCAHCHEQHASIGGSEPAPNSPAGPDQFLLFSDSYTDQTNNFCVECHKIGSSIQSVTNHSYSFRAGRLSTDFLSSADIRTAFSYCYLGCTTPPASYSSSHNLDNIRAFINGKWNYTADSNPCAACHNPHMVVGDPANAQNDYKSSSARGYTPVSRPSLHSKETSVWGLWGDIAAERMNVKASSLGAGIYQSPRNSDSTYEPDGSTTQDGSNLTDFVSFCTDCHNESNIINTSHFLFDPTSKTISRSTLFKIDWAKEWHGGNSGFVPYCSMGTAPDTISLLAQPYDGKSANCGKYVLSCTDCHEPHGSPNNFLVRPRVNNGFNDCKSSSSVICASNGSSVTVTNYGTATGTDSKENKEWVYLCGKCHTNLNSGDAHTHPQADYNLNGSVYDDCLWCHPNGGDYRNCGECHYHGSTYTSIFGANRPLF